MKKKLYSLGFMGHCSHDPSACLISFDIESKEFNINYAEEGFLSRKKKSYQFPIRAIKYCLDREKIELNDIDIICNDFMDKKRIFKTSNNHRQLCGDFIRSKLSINSKTKLFYPESHHYAHAIVASIASKNNKGSVLIADGLGSEQQTHSIYSFSKENGLKRIMQQKGNGIGILYTLITNDILNFDKGEEGKTMGLAAYGEEVDLKKEEIPSFKGKYNGLNVDYSHIVERAPSAKLKIKLKKVLNKEQLYDDYFTGLSYALQIEAENCLMYLVKNMIKQIGTSDVIFSGGVALNCVANSKISELNEVNSLYVYPASGDSAIPIGLSIAGLESLGVDVFNSSDLANKLNYPYSQDVAPLEKEYKNDLNSYLKKSKIKAYKYEPNKIAELLSDDKVGALFSEGIEVGPRALGHRSFIASANKKEMKEIMNRKIKHREGYRPFAPIIRDINFQKYFNSNVKDHPYMLQAPKCNERAQEEVPAIVHEDKTARVQTVKKAWAIKFWEILKSYEVKTGNLSIINTSLNNNNEPIVFTELDAWICFLTCNADFLIVNNIFYLREEIQNTKKLFKDLNNLREKVNLSYFKNALLELTNINKNTNVEDIYSFINFSSNLSKAYKNERLYQKLIDDLTCTKKIERIVTDKYHLEILELIKKITNIKINYQITIINDNFNDLEILKKGDYVLAYNLCGFIDDSDKYKKKIYNFFYKISDTKLNINNLLSKFNSQIAEFSALDFISESYENSLDSNLLDFFRNLNIRSDK